MPIENLRGVVRSKVYRYRALVFGSMKHRVYRQFQTILAIYEQRFGADVFADDMRKNILAPLSRRMWLPGGYAHWRIRTTGQSRETLASSDFQRSAT